jgi:hypothetical protein
MVMGEEFFDIVVINFNKYVLWGRYRTGNVDKWGVREEKYIEQVLTDEQKALLWNIEHEYQKQRAALLASFVVRD